MIKRLLYIASILILVGFLLAWFGFRYAYKEYNGESQRIYIPKNTTESTLKTLFIDSLDEQFGRSVFNIWKLRNGNLSRAHGSYLVKRGESAISLATRIRGGVQDPVNVTIPNSRSTKNAVEAIASYFEFSSDSLYKALETTLIQHDLNKSLLAAIILPDTYQYYWTSSPAYVAESIYRHWNKFWTQERLDKATSLGLTTIDVSTLASIVEEESAKRDERPLIARLYLNRLKNGMRLQADPTVKYAVGNPALKRILNSHLSTESPYNTYLHYGLPPGPIRIVDKQTLNSVLDAPMHNYIYMCAKEDFSGYHNFAKTLAEHNENARKYHTALNKLNIK